MTRLSLHDALVAARHMAIHLPAQWVDLEDAQGRVLADDVTARRDVPAADVSIMDGWAARAGDLPGTLTIVGESRAGAPWNYDVGPRQAVRISTGAVMPRGADTVVKLEDGREHDGALRTEVAPAAGHDIRRAADDLREGQPVVRARTIVGAHHIWAVAAAGHGRVRCHARPVASLITAGEELVDPGGTPGPGEIFNANGPGLTAQFRDAGADVRRVITVGDDPEATRRAIDEALDGANLMVLAGGMSVGPHDHVRSALDDAGFDPVFTRLAARPGRPTSMGSIGECRVLALPGNPAAAAVGMHLLGRTLLSAEAPWTSMPLASDVDTAPDLDLIVRCWDDGGFAEPLANQNSGSVGSVAGADVLAWIPPGDQPLRAGSTVMVSRL